MAANKETTPTYEDIQAQLAFLQLKKLQKEEAQQEDEAHQQRQIQLAGAKAAQQTRDNELAAQRGCSHKKERGMTAVVGTRDSKQHVHYLCQRCSKTFTQENVGELMPDPRTIGGPSVGFAE